jgi:hypothetical protein
MAAVRSHLLHVHLPHYSGAGRTFYSGHSPLAKALRNWRPSAFFFVIMGAGGCLRRRVAFATVGLAMQSSSSWSLFATGSSRARHLARTLHIAPRPHDIAAQWRRVKCVSVSGARVAPWPCHCAALYPLSAYPPTPSSSQLPAQDSISVTLFSHPLPNALIGAWGRHSLALHLLSCSRLST